MYENSPKEPGFYWVINDGKLEIGYVANISNGTIGVINGAFDYDWGKLYWGDKITIHPDLIPFKAKFEDKTTYDTRTANRIP